MVVDEVKKLSPIDQFIYWIRERHQIYLKRRVGQPKPWTDDEVLRSYFFTNPYRENDKVTVWFRENIREPLRDRPEVLFATVCFRWFNLPRTGELLAELPWTNTTNNLLLNWDSAEVLVRLGEARGRGEQIFTGAFMINSPPGEPKLEAIVRRINNVWEAREELLDKFNAFGRFTGQLSLQGAHELLMAFDGMGGFMAYEVVCDLRYTYLLENAPDKLTWCNPGPGCIRGLYRILGRDFEKGNNSSSPPKPPDWLERMQWLRGLTSHRLPRMKFEMREIEHSLCEYDKYCRALYGDGKLKRKYNG